MWIDEGFPPICSHQTPTNAKWVGYGCFDMPKLEYIRLEQLLLRLFLSYSCLLSSSFAIVGRGRGKKGFAM
jgi:hypothetical protein